MEKKEVPVVFIEGLAAVGKIKKYWEEDCDTGLRRRVYVETFEGDILYTPCIDHRAIKKVILVLSEYKRISSLIVEEKK